MAGPRTYPRPGVCGTVGDSGHSQRASGPRSHLTAWVGTVTSPWDRHFEVHEG